MSDVLERGEAQAAQTHSSGDYCPDDKAASAVTVGEQQQQQEHDRIVVRRTVMRANLIPYQQTAEESKSYDDAVQKIGELPFPLSLLGFHELLLPSMYKAVLIEFVGTAVFIYAHIAIVLACQLYTYPPLQIGIGHFFLLSLFILQFAMSSGAHFNSLITMSSMLTGHLPALRGCFYVTVQVLGATLGAEAFRKSVPELTARSIALGSCSIGTLQTQQAFAAEVFFSLLLLFSVYGIAFNLRQREIYGPILPPFLIGLTLGLNIFCSTSLAPPPFTGAGMNPSLCLGTAWAYSNVVTGRDALRYQWIYWVGPIVASAINAVLYYVAPPHHEQQEIEQQKLKTV